MNADDLRRVLFYDIQLATNPMVDDDERNLIRKYLAVANEEFKCSKIRGQIIGHMIAALARYSAWSAECHVNSVEDYRNNSPLILKTITDLFTERFKGELQVSARYFDDLKIEKSEWRDKFNLPKLEESIGFTCPKFLKNLYDHLLLNPKLDISFDISSINDHAICQNPFKLLSQDYNPEHNQGIIQQSRALQEGWCFAAYGLPQAKAILWLNNKGEVWVSSLDRTPATKIILSNSLEALFEFPADIANQGQIVLKANLSTIENQDLFDGLKCLSAPKNLMVSFDLLTQILTQDVPTLFDCRITIELISCEPVGELFCLLKLNVDGIASETTVFYKKNQYYLGSIIGILNFVSKGIASKEMGSESKALRAIHFGRNIKIFYVDSKEVALIENKGGKEVEVCRKIPYLDIISHNYDFYLNSDSTQFSDGIALIAQRLRIRHGEIAIQNLHSDHVIFTLENGYSFFACLNRSFTAPANTLNFDWTRYNQRIEFWAGDDPNWEFGNIVAEINDQFAKHNDFVVYDITNGTLMEK